MIFGLFSKERAFERLVKKATNKLSQSADRWAALEKLREMATDESLYQLLRRFSFSCLKSVDDEQEKAWVLETMTALGEPGLPALRRYMKSSTTIAYPLQILGAVGDKAKVLAIIDELLGAEEPGYTRDPEKRIQIIDWLSEYTQAQPAEVAARVTPYLADFDENSRFAAAEALSRRPCPEAAPMLLAAMVNDAEESGRLKSRIAEILCDAALPLGEHKKQVSALLDTLLSDYMTHGDKLVRKIKK